MPIASAIHNGNLVLVYDHRGQCIKSLPVGRDDELCGYTSGDVSIRRGGRMYIYDIYNNRVHTRDAPRPKARRAASDPIASEPPPDVEDEDQAGVEEEPPGLRVPRSARPTVDDFAHDAGIVASRRVTREIVDNVLTNIRAGRQPFGVETPASPSPATYVLLGAGVAIFVVVVVWLFVRFS